MKKCCFGLMVLVVLLAAGLWGLNDTTKDRLIDSVREHLPISVTLLIWGPDAVIESQGFDAATEEHVDDEARDSESPQGDVAVTGQPDAPESQGESGQSGESGQRGESDEAGSSGEAGDSGDPERVGTEPVVFEENPRYTIAVDPELGEVLRSEVRQGDVMGKLLDAWFTPNEVAAIITAAKPVWPLTNIHVGRPFAVVRDASTKTVSLFKYEVDKNRRLVVERAGEGFSARFEKIDYETRLVAVRGQLTTNLINAVTGQGEGVGFAIALADVFGSEINFITDPREGDTFEVLVEKQFRHDQFRDYGRIVAARYLNDGKLHEAYLFRDTSGRAAYFNGKGESLHRAILKAPLSFLRVTSKYSMARRHPVSGQVKPHQGIDYGAPSGTPIMAVGHGTVTLAGRAGGYGNQVIIRHGNGLESLYGHMSRFARGISSGKSVRQGQTIGYVGATGVATGPHLDFRIKQGGKFVNPGKLVVPRDPGVSSRNMAAFKATAARIDELWTGAGGLESYDPDTFWQ